MVTEGEDDESRALGKLTSATDELKSLNSRMDVLLVKLRAGEFDKQDDPEGAAYAARVRRDIDGMSAKLTSNLKASELQASQAKSNALQALGLAGLIFKALFGGPAKNDDK